MGKTKPRNEANRGQALCGTMRFSDFCCFNMWFIFKLATTNSLGMRLSNTPVEKRCELLIAFLGLFWTDVEPN